MTVTSPVQLREQLEGRTTRKRVTIAAKFRPGDEPDTVLAATRYAMKKHAQRFRTPHAEIKDLDRQLTRLANGDQRCKAYVKKRTGGSKAHLDVLRRLKRHTAREVYPLLLEALSDAQDELPGAA